MVPRRREIRDRSVRPDPNFRSQLAAGLAPLARDVPATHDLDDLAARLVASQRILLLKVQAEASPLHRFEIDVATHRNETLVCTLERAHWISLVQTAVDSVVLEQPSVDI